MTRHVPPQQQRGQQEGGTLAGLALLVALVALIFSFFAHSFAIFLALVVIVMSAVALVRARRGRPGKEAAVVAIVLAVLAWILAAALSPDAEEGVQQAAAPIDPNALPATVTIARVQSPDNLVTTEGRRVHVTMMQGRDDGTDACRAGVDTATATRLVAGQQVSIAAPAPRQTDVGSAVPAGFQSVVMTLADGRDYAESWQNAADESWVATCLATEETTTEAAPTTTSEATSEPDVDVDVDRPYVPAPQTRKRSGQSGHLCLPGERDGDGDGYCGE